jgi:hypothetical protein
MEKLKISKEWADTFEQYLNCFLLHDNVIFAYNSLKISQEIKEKKNIWGKISKKTTYYLEDIHFLCLFKDEQGTFKDSFIKSILTFRTPLYLSNARMNFIKVKKTLEVLGHEIIKKKKDNEKT